MKNKKANTIYLSHNGLLEPLGQSQVMNYLKGLSENYSINVISYEKSENFSNESDLMKIRKNCESFGINWFPQVFQPNKNFFILIFVIIKMIWLVWRFTIKNKIDLIHARSYIPTTVALIINKFTNVPFIFDMRALWSEELINSSKITRGSFKHRVLLKIERSCIAKSAAIVSLTNILVNYLKDTYPNEMKNQEITVIPTCADLKNFIYKKIKKQNYLTHGCIGTVLSSWFLTDRLKKWIEIASYRDPTALFEIVTLDNYETVKTKIDPENKLEGRLKIYSKHPEEMPNVLHKHNLSIMFFSDGLSKLGSAPTRMAEALGSGLPIVINEGVGDTSNIIRENNVGVIIKDNDQKSIEEAFEKLLILLKDPNLNIRCRKTAEKLFSLEYGTNLYKKIYEKIISKKDKSCVV